MSEGGGPTTRRSARVMPERVIKAAADVSPLDAFGGKATRERRIRVRSQRSERLQFPAYHKMASAISSAGGRFRPLPATFDASTPRSGDGRSTDCMSSEHFGQLAWQFKRVSGSSGL